MQTIPNLSKVILGIDTSCDETSASVVKDLAVLSNVMPSQMEFHQKYGGVVPSLAKLAHQERIEGVINEALKRAGYKIEDTDVIAVTYGPGLAIALEVGLRKAKELAEKYNKPLVIINHMEGHLLSSFAKPKAKVKKTESREVNFPAMGFLISGNHTELVLIENFGKYTKIGEALDDSCGEAYDKCGRMLGLGYPAGPVISEFAKRHRKDTTVAIVKHHQGTSVKVVNVKTKKEYSLPIAMVNSGDLNFSFSGLKTAFKQLIDKVGTLNKETIEDLCITFEAAALSQLTIKLESALKKYPVNELWLGGGVVASAQLRKLMRQICKKNNILLRAPFNKKLTGDNDAMIAVTASLKIMNKPIKHDPGNGIYLRDFSSIDRDPSLSL